MNDLIEEQDPYSLNVNGYLCRAEYSHCRRKIMNNKIADKDKDIKTFFNRKNTIFSCEYLHTSKDTYCNHYIWADYYITLNTKDSKKETRGSNTIKST